MSEQPTSSESTEQVEAPVEPVEAPVTSEPPLTRRHITAVVIVALTLSTLIITPGIIADYMTAQYLKPKAMDAKHPNDTRWKDLIRRRGVPIKFEGQNRIPMQGWLLRPHRGHKRLVFYMHDFSRDHRDGYDLTKELLNNGLSVFVYDMRAHGKSAGKAGRRIRQMAHDARSMLSYLRRLFPSAWKMPTATIGVGMGGSVALLVATMDGNFRNVIAVNPPFDPEAQINKLFKGYPKFLVTLTKKRVERVASMNYRMNSILKNANRLRDSFVMLLGPSKAQRSMQWFCSKTKGKCTYAAIHSPKPMEWWSKMSSKRRNALMVFLLQRFRLPVARYRLRLPPRPRVKRKKARYPRRIRTKRAILRKPSLIRRVLKRKKPAVRKKILKPLKRVKPRKPGTRKAMAPKTRRVRHIRSGVRVNLGRALKPKPRVAGPAPRGVLVRPAQRKTQPPGRPSTQPTRRK